MERQMDGGRRLLMREFTHGERTSLGTPRQLAAVREPHNAKKLAAASFSGVLENCAGYFADST
jgi:hypothetical protein